MRSEQMRQEKGQEWRGGVGREEKRRQMGGGREGMKKAVSREH